ncbi:MAG: fibronectin type III domain-containing protein, partial [Bacteroidetes bacterium]
YHNSIAAAQSPLPAGSGSTAVTATLSGLTTGQAYYYVVEATNSAGTTTGSEESFTPVAGPSCFAFQGFEGTPGDNWTISNGAANISSVAGAGDTPSNQRIRTGNFSWLVNNGTGTLDLAPFSVSGITNVTVTVRLSSTSGTTGNGADGGDFVRVFADLDGGGFPATADVALEGFSNARYGYDATLTASTTAGTPISVAAPQGGTSTNNYATIEINIPDGTSTVGLRVTALNSDGNEFWNIDDIELCGVIASGPCVAPTAQPTALTLTPVGTDQLDGGFTAAGDADSYLIIRSLDGTLDSSPVDGTSYSAGQALTGDDVVEGFITGTTFSATGLSSGTQYHYFIIAANSIGCTGGPVYYLTSPLTGSAFTNPEGVASGDIDVLCTSPTEMTVTWTGPTSAFDGYLLVGRQGASPSAVNILDPQTATASTVFGAEEYVMITESSLLYIGTATSATITGLTPGLSYTFQIYTYVASQFSDEGNSGPTTSATAEVREVSGFSGVPVNQGANLSWANLPAGCFDEVLIVASTASVTATPTGDGSAYTADAAFGSGTAIVPGEFVVYQGTGTTTAVSGLTNGTPYFFKAFVRVGNFWSAGVEISVVPNDVTIFAPGDFMIVAVNTTALPSGGTDEVCFIAFQDITPGTIFEITDNGYERVTAGLWGDTEGVIRFERDATASTVPAGTPICLLGAGNTAGDFEVYVDGTLDADWIISSLNGIAQFNLNASDQVWFLQGGNWVNPGGSHDATYTGEVLYGWTGTGWEAAPGYASTSGSTLFPGLDCFVADLQSIPNFDKAKFTNPTPATLNSQRAWLTAAKDPANWTGSVDNATYNALTPDYRGTSNVFAITAGGLSGSDWIGDANDNWFDCGNWSALLVPEQGDAVTILTTSTNTARIDGTAPFASRYAGIALAGSLVIQTGQEVRMETDDAYLRVAGDLTIETGAALIADNGAGNTATIEVGGLWVDNEPTGGFDAGTGSTVIFNGSALQGISAVSSIAEFANIELDNPNGLDLGVPVGVIGDFNFVNGLVQTTSSLLLSFRDNATATGASDASHVNGPVEKAGDEAFVFPVGKGGQYRPIEMSAPALTTDTYRAEYFAGNGQAVFGTAKEVGIGFVSPLEYWQFDEISVAPATAVALTLNWNATSNIDPADVFAVRWDGSQWTQVGGAGAAGGITGSPFSGTVTSAAETDFSPVTFGSNGTSFPVELLDLQASLNAGAVTLDWLTASERNSSHFVVERSAD